MHNIDRTADEMEFLNEFEQDFGNEMEVEGESEFEAGGEGEFEDRYEFEYNDFAEFEAPEGEFDSEFEMELETDYEQDSEVMEMELATDLLSVSNEAEMEEFLGKLFSKAKKAAGQFIKSPTGNLLKNYLKGLAKKALPIAGTALGGMIGGPLGAQVGAGATQMVGKALGLELEGLSPEDKEFEVAKGYVRFATDAVKRAASNPAQRYSPQSVARSAMTQAARRYAPGFLSPRFADNFRKRFPVRGHSRGTWVRRRDGAIILYGL